MDQEKIYWILKCIRMLSLVELSKILQDWRDYDNDFFVLPDDVISTLKSEDFLNKDFLNTLTSEYIKLIFCDARPKEQTEIIKSVISSENLNKVIHEINFNYTNFNCKQYVENIGQLIK